MSTLLLAALLLGPGDATARTDTVASPVAAAVVANDNRIAAGRLERGVLTLRLEVRAATWTPEADDGSAIPAWAFAEEGKAPRIPGPLVRVPAGTEVRITIRNALADSTIAVHGLHGRPASAADEGIRLAPGESREVRFRLTEPGTHHYWGAVAGRSLGAREWLDSQLSGAIVVDPAGGPASDRVFVITIWDQPKDTIDPARRERREVMTINGKSWPHTERMALTRGETVRWRWINATDRTHPMHLHGFYFVLEAIGNGTRAAAVPPDRQALIVTELMDIGTTMDMRFVPDRDGNWVFHCHFAFHVSDRIVLPSVRPLVASRGVLPAGAEGHAHGNMPHRMAGLVIAMHVAPPKGAAPAPAPSATPRALRLMIQEKAKVFDERPAYGYLLQQGAEPARDSIAIPGSLLLLRRGEPVRFTIVNRLAQATAVHWHGIELESFPDGVPGVSGYPGRLMPPIAARDSFVAEFTPPRAGTFMYHTHANELDQMRAGLYGPLVVYDETHPFDPAVDKLIVVGGGGTTARDEDDPPVWVNGTRAVEPMVMEVGRTYRFRLININPDWRAQFSLVSDTAMLHWRPIAKDGADLPPALTVSRPAHLVTGPGETADFEFTPSEPGRLRLEVKSRAPGWYVPVPIQVRAATP